MLKEAAAAADDHDVARVPRAGDRAVTYAISFRRGGAACEASPDLSIGVNGVEPVPVSLSLWWYFYYSVSGAMVLEWILFLRLRLQWRLLLDRLAERPIPTELS